MVLFLRKGCQKPRNHRGSEVPFGSGEGFGVRYGWNYGKQSAGLFSLRGKFGSCALVFADLMIRILAAAKKISRPGWDDCLQLIQTFTMIYVKYLPDGKCEIIICDYCEI